MQDINKLQPTPCINVVSDLDVQLLVNAKKDISICIFITAMVISYKWKNFKLGKLSPISSCESVQKRHNSITLAL